MVLDFPADKVVGALLTASALVAQLALTLAVVRRLLFGVAVLGDSGGEDASGFEFVCALASARIDKDLDPCRLMGHADGALCFLSVLPAGAMASLRVDF